ncbi:hypothetical protein ACRALDRAFT_1058457 [Sodiomyces alcalophilus JCM 7366]|uniref:uncharacterized protein n=1 Tax=Sodiomyces alcalophilus JCM 7366 TaxID=591952 RepID=UPI0039B6A020
MTATTGVFTNPEVEEKPKVEIPSSTTVQSGDDGSARDQLSNTAASTPATDSERETKPPEDVRTLRGLKWFFAYTSLLSTTLLYALDGTIVAAMQPAILDTYGETEKLPWIGVGMFLGALTVLPIGRAFGVFNVKWLFLGLVILFEVGSVLCGAAPNMDAFIVGRVIQGIGACGCYLGAVTYISMTTTVRERPLYLSGIIATWSMGSVLGPVVGGAFAQSSATWRWAFYINLLIAAVFAPPLILCLPNIDPAADLTFVEKLLTQDWASMVIFLGGSACLSMALTFGGTVYAFDSRQEIALWTVSGVLLIVFVLVTVYHPLVEYRHRLYPIHLMKSMELNILQFAIFMAAGSMVTSLYYIPLLFQFTRGDGALIAGVRLLPFLCGMVFASVANGALMPRLGYYMPWYVLGNGLILIGSALMVTVEVSTSDAHIYGYTVILGVGCGSFFTSGFSVVQALVEPSELSNAISYMAIGQTLGQIIILSLGGSLFQNIGAQRLSKILPGVSQEEIIELTTGTHSTVFEALDSDLQAQVVHTVTMAIRNVFYVLLATAAPGLIGSLCLSRRKIY